MRHARSLLIGVLIGSTPPTKAFAANLDGAHLGLGWALPFVGDASFDRSASSVGASFLGAPSGQDRGSVGRVGGASAFAVCGGGTGDARARAYGPAEYIPFILLLLALFTVAGGIVVRGNLYGSPVSNTVLLAVGTLLASIIGTTGASMVMIRPLVRANDDRNRNVHVFVFFIFLVSNIGGSLSPLGDPPLFLGFLRGVDFFWTTRHLLPKTALVAGLLLAVFFIIDAYLYRKEGRIAPDPTPDNPLLR